MEGHSVMTDSDSGNNLVQSVLLTNEQIKSSENFTSGNQTQIPQTVLFYNSCLLTIPHCFPTCWVQAGKQGLHIVIYSTQGLGEKKHLHYSRVLRSFSQNLQPCLLSTSTSRAVLPAQKIKKRDYMGNLTHVIMLCNSI